MTNHPLLERIRDADLIARNGRVTRIMPTYIEADGPGAPLGALCTIDTASVTDGYAGEALAQVISVGVATIRLALFDQNVVILPGAKVRARTQADRAPVGAGFLARVVDALGRPLDGHGPIIADAIVPLQGRNETPLDRVSPQAPLETGLRAIDGLLTLGHGQRIGVFAPAGVGKTSLMTQLVNQVEADRYIICLVGERGREVEALWSTGLNEATKARTTLVAATSDQAASMRVRAASYAVALADHWRQQGEKVLLVMDSATRLAMALREVGLAAGEPPTVRAYTPSVFAAVPRLVERCGALKQGGAITAIFTVLSETEEMDDPICEMMKSLLDGHILLSRSLAEQGHFPAIDIPRSISRLAASLTNGSHRRAAERAVAVLSTYEESRTLIETGMYVRGSSADIDRALDLRPGLLNFLKQASTEKTSFKAAGNALADLVGRAA